MSVFFVGIFNENIWLLIVYSSQPSVIICSRPQRDQEGLGEFNCSRLVIEALADDSHHCKLDAYVDVLHLVAAHNPLQSLSPILLSVDVLLGRDRL